MTFDRPWLLPLAALPVLWVLWEMRRTRRLGALIVKALCFTAIALAVAEPRLNTNETKMAVAVLVDTSVSIGPQDLARESQLATTLESGKGRHWVQVVPFAKTPRNAATGEHSGSWKLAYTSGDQGHSTDLEAAIRGAIAELPTGMVPRVVLISDGKENAGSITRAAWQAQTLGIPIDTFALNGRAEPNLRLESVSLPTVAFTGERFPVDLTVIAPRKASGTVEISAEGKLLGSNPITLEAGANQVRLHPSIVTAGAINLSGVLKSAELGGDVRFDRSVTLRRPRVLYVSQDPEGTESHLMQTLAAGQFVVDRVSELGKAALADYQIVVFNNWDLESLPIERKDEAERFVKQGGGLLVIGGERNLYDEKKKVEDALDRALPAKVAPPKSPEGTCVVLIIDKSSSMEGKKIELARQSAIGVIENLRPIDSVGVLIFDNSFQWAVPIRRAEDRTLIKRLVAGITPDGGTQIAPALTEAFRKALPVKATFKHIVLLTDGISEEGDSLDVSRDAALQHVTISTVGLGQDVNRAYLEKVASLAGGKAYFLNEPTGLEQILLKDVMEHTGSTAVEKSLKPAVAKRVEILEGVGIETAPALKGYVKFQAKPTADTILSIDKDPLLSRWQYGLGRSMVFASDAKSRWASDWVTWNGFDKFWTNIFRDLLPHSPSGEAKAEYDSASGDLIVQYQLGRNIEEPRKLPAIFAIGPAGFQKPVPIIKMADGSFRGRLPIGERQGLFRVRPLEESRAFPEVGFYRQEQELQDYGSNQFLLREIAEFTGGRFNPNPKEVFDPGGRSIPSSMRLWPGLLGFAIALNLIELFLRKARAAFRK